MPSRKTTTSQHKAADHPLVSSGTKPRGITKPSVTKPRVIKTLSDHPLVFSDIIESRAITKPIATTTSKGNRPKSPTTTAFKGKAADQPLAFSTRPSVDKPRAFTTFQDKASDYPLNFSGTKPRGNVKPSISTASKRKAAGYPRKFSGIKPKGVTKSTTTKPQATRRSLAALYGRNDDLYDILALSTTRPTRATKTSDSP